MGIASHPNSLGLNPHHGLLSLSEYAAVAFEGLGLSLLALKPFGRQVSATLVPSPNMPLGHGAY